MIDTCLDWTLPEEADRLTAAFICLKLMYMTISVFCGLNYLSYLDIQNELAKKTGSPETTVVTKAGY